MGHSQFAEYVGARGPNTQVNAACASTTQAFALAEDWIRAGRCRRVVVLGADDVTTDHLLEWIGAGFLASGAAATDDVVEEAALPFDRRRHGMLLGMGAMACVVEHPQCARERGLRPICEVLGTVVANSAFHGTRLDEQHIAELMETLVSGVERRFGLDRGRARPRAPVRLPRDLHAGARRERLGGGERAAPGVRRRRRARGRGQHEGPHRPPDGSGHRGRRGDQGARDGRRAPGAELPRARPRPRPAQPLEGRRLPDPLRPASRRGLRLPDLPLAPALGADARRPSAGARRPGLREPPRRPRRLRRVARADERRSRRRARGGPAHPSRAGPAARSRARAACAAAGAETGRSPARAVRSAARARARAARPRARASGLPSPRCLRRPRTTRRSASGCSRSWPRRRATRPTCSTSTSTSRPTSASTP